jgi:para-nitrobenzyl esterase
LGHKNDREEDAMGGKVLVIVAATAALATGAAFAQAAAVPPTPAIEKMPAKGKLTVTSPAFKAEGDIPLENTQYRGNRFPGLAWTKGPAGTQSYVVILQDVDRPTPTGPLLHWSMYKVPATVRSLPPGMVDPPAGAAYGPNYKGAGQAYLGPHTPPGPKHHYHLQVFALDTTLPDPGKSYDTMTAAMSGHILASGELVGLGHADPDAKPAPAAK